MENTNTHQADHGKLMNKMAEVIKVTGNVAKKGTNKDQGYKFATHSDIIEELRKHIAEKGIFILPKPESYETTEITSRSGTKGALITMKMDFEIVDTETGYSITVKWFGQGMDYGDKAMYKSYTGALKYFLLDTFMISTGDDPENADAEAAKPSKPVYNAPRSQAKPIVQPPMSEFQKNKVKGLLVEKNKSEADVESYCQKAFRKPYAAISIPEANILIKNLEKAEPEPGAQPGGEEIDVDEVDRGIEAMKAEEVAKALNPETPAPEQLKTEGETK